MRNLTTLLLLVAVVFGVTGVGYANPDHALPDKDKDKDKNKARVARQFETRVYTRKQCILSENAVTPKTEFITALAAIFLPMLLKKTLGGVGAAIKKAGDPEELKDSGKVPTYLYKVSDEAATDSDGKSKRGLVFNPDLRCVLIVRGIFDAPVKSASASFPEPGIFTGAQDEPKRVARLQSAGINISEIASVFEAAITFSNDKTALYYEGRFLEVNSFQGMRDAKTRALVVSIALNGAGPKDGDSTLSLSLMNLGEVARGEIRGPDRMKNIRSSWLGGLSISDDALAHVETIPSGDTPLVMPVTVEGTLVETEKGSKALRFIAEILDASKDEVSETISDAVLNQEKVKEEKANALEKLMGEEESAYGAYLTSENELSNFDKETEANPPKNEADKKIRANERRIKVVALESARRSWCNKMNALRNLGRAPSDRKATCP